MREFDIVFSVFSVIIFTFHYFVSKIPVFSMYFCNKSTLTFQLNVLQKNKCLGCMVTCWEIYKQYIHGGDFCTIGFTN